MAYNNDQKEIPLPTDGENRRRSSNHLPRYFRTQVNNKFLSSTIDQLIQPGSTEKLNGYFGKKTSKGFSQSDFYVGDVSKNREDYQLEPSAVISDDLGNTSFYADYNDYINQIKSLGGSISDHNLLNRQEYYSWDPHIDWDKVVNFREYYWLPNGPQAIPVSGNSTNVVSTYTVTSVNNGENYGYVLTPDGLTQNPELTLYRGITYRFEINTPGLPLSFRTRKDSAPLWKPFSFYNPGDRVLYKGIIYSANEQHRSVETLEIDLEKWSIDNTFNLIGQVSQQSVDVGTIEVKLDFSTPDIIYYVSDRDIFAGGIIRVKDISEASEINVEEEIIGKKNYVTNSGFSLSNGMKIFFQGNVTPAEYSIGAWYVEGVGDKIKLVSEEELSIPSAFTEDLLLEFDNEGFDRFPYSEAIGYPIKKDYITINRASIDGNLWSKYNRWFHKDVIELSEKINNQAPELDQNQRATRPIIEFEANLKLVNFGSKAKKPVDLVDNFTKDVFSTVEGSIGYNIDGIDLTNGMRVMFIADNDELVRGKIFEVKFILIQNSRQITLQETNDSNPIENETVLCKQGNLYKGKIFWYSNNEWKLAQDKTTTNQQPLFDIFDSNGNSYSDSSIYESTTFVGTKIYSYKRGSGTNDKELNFPLAYRSIENIGDILFKFDLLSDTVSYLESGSDPKTEKIHLGFLRKYSDINKFENLNGWKIANDLSSQAVVQQYVVDNSRTFYTINVYDQSALIKNLWIKVFLNNQLQFENKDFTISSDSQNNAIIKFNKTLSLGDIIIIKTKADVPKNDNGYYEMPANFERNPLNENIEEFTLGEVNDHVGTIIEEVSGFEGLYPGPSNLRDLGNVSKFGKRIVKHSAPLNLSLYHLIDKNANLVKSLKYARREYGKFKRLFLQTAYNLGFDGPVKEHVDNILAEMNKDKTKSMPFYFSDMIPTGASKKSIIEVDDVENNFFALTNIFNINEPSDKAVQVYKNGKQLLIDKDYKFNDQGFVIITAQKSLGDIIEIYEYETTNGCFCPPTPTKLGLYPKFEPSKFIDNTYLEPKEVIQGHDGSIVITYGDYRDDLILELEHRIFNNLKINYDVELFDINDYVPGENRNTGLTKKQIDDTMLSDFVQWLQLVDEDYTKHIFFERTNTFTFNHQGMTDPSGNEVSGWWRAVYKWAYDTDRPHTHPWEMLGFSIKPNWWDDQYGEAPYTSDNLLMWEDISLGIIREPNKIFRTNKKYVRKDLLSHLPVDDQGNLVSPILSSYIRSYNSTELNFNFIYGDNSPVETAWRRSSEFPFALLTSLFLNQPSRVMSTCFDRIRQKRGLAGDIVYEKNNTQLSLKNLIFPNSINDSVRIYTSGLINYISDYLSSKVTSSFDDYKNNLVSINNQIGFKIGGFTIKDKFKLILDSRTPLNKGNVFVPEENYKIFLNSSSPIDTIYYSGVLIEKQSNGFVIRGYNQEQPYFYYNQPINLANDALINIGGISQSFVIWEENKTYSQGAIVEYQSSFYRVVSSHTSTNSFDSDKFSKLAKLPEVGGREVYFRKQFQEVVSTLSYGTVLKTIQEVVDFLLGYSHYLEMQGFVFDFYSGQDEFVSDWKTSAKEFVFWTTQNWSAGSVIALSPAAYQLKFISKFSVVDDIYDTFYGYSLLKADGKKLLPEFVSLSREEPNEFLIRPKNTEDGIFAVRISLIQKEHVVLIDNRTVFGDIIYDQEPGYRQDRIRVLGYRTTNWDGSINIPGFIFDNAVTTEWKPWKDYSIGDLVRYKEFYYTARNKISGSEVFDANQWVRLEDKPEMGLIPNFEYKINQFADFYDLDTDNFDTEQQKFAQHLIGYQNRQYLANIINDDVSQYKFYQGMIQDKGTKNALSKLFDVLSSADKESLEFYEEWAIRVGQYGAASGFEEVEYILDESKIRLEPQSFEFVNQVQGDETDLVYRIRPFEASLRPLGYDHSPFPGKYVTDTFSRNSGYVNPEDIDFIVASYDSILNINFKECKFGNTIWVGNENLSWNVYCHIRTNLLIESIEPIADGAVLILNSTDIDLSEGEIIGIFDVPGIEGFYKISKKLNNRIEIKGPTVTESDEPLIGRITKLVSVRVKDFAEGSNLLQNTKEGISRIWIDNETTGEWKVLDNTGSFDLHQIIRNNDAGENHSYGVSLASDEKNTVLIVGSPDIDNGKVFIYTRAGNSGSYQLVQELVPTEGLANDLEKFGSSVAVTSDGRYLVVGSPEASNVKSTFTGSYNESADYATGSIVNYQDSLWESLVDIDGSEDNIIFDSFESVPQIMTDLNLTDEDDERIPVILTGDYPFKNINTDHFIIKAPKNMYQGSGIGDTLRLKWNKISYAHQDKSTLVEVDPFDGDISLINGDFLTSNHIIAEKIDSILYVENSNTIPLVGQIVETIGGFGTVAYRFNDGAKVTIYVKNQNGSFGTLGSLTTSIGEFVGEYITVAPAEQTLNADDKWGGYWRINTDEIYLVEDKNSDEGRGLVYFDVVPAGETDPDRKYYNILDFDTNLVSSKDTRNSQLTSLTYEGLPGPGGVVGVFESRLFVLRAPSELTNAINIITPGNQDNSRVDIFYNPMASFLSGEFKNPQDIGLSLSDINKNHVVYDLWDGYIDFQITKNLNGVPIEPKVGIIVQDVSNLGTGEVAFYQKFDTINARVYLKNVSGDWAAGNLFGENREIQFLADGSGDTLYDPAAGFRVFGQIQSRSLPLESQGIGKMIVLDKGANILLSKSEEDNPSDEYYTILDGEYWFYNEGEVAGIPRPANIPSEQNNDWRQIYNVPASISGTPSGLTNEGMYHIYERRGVGQFIKINSYIVPERSNNLKLGSKFKFGKINDLYRLFVEAEGNSNVSSPGRIYFISNGLFNGYQYGWEFNKDKQYTGEFNSSRTYFENDIVFYESNLYQALTNIAPGEFNVLDWQAIVEPREYIGYVPNDTGLILNDFDVLDQNSLIKFSRDFDVSRDGEIFVVSVEYDNTKPNVLVIYRNINGLYYKSQVIEAPSNTIDYGTSVSISSDGKLIAVGAPYNDIFGTDYGSVYIYKQVNGAFEISQTLKSPEKDRAELFGYSLDFNGNTLIVGSRNGDSFIETTFDSKATTFDQHFTKYRSFNKDSGIVRIFERIDDIIGYAQTIDFDNDNVRYFGRNILLSNNHIYVALPNFTENNRQGIIIDFRKPDNTNIWNHIRVAKQTVDLNKIKRVVLYNTKTNQLIQYLDYIDVLQGKIPGPAEQELTYKTYFDPATYTFGVGVNVDPTNTWGTNQIGQLWWDLTNAKFLNPYQDSVIFSANNWNKSFSTINTVDIYEWVESEYIPSEWDSLSGTDAGLRKGITGKSRYGDDGYVAKRVYDSASSTFKTYYYFWVKDKTTIPFVENRTLSANDVAKLISDPASEGYKFISLISPTQFALHNCKSLIVGSEVALGIQYWVIDNQTINIHNQYQILTEGLETSRPNRDIEQKWFDSLVGYDNANREVPSPELSVKERYGNLNRPRQSWFVNRTEALKQLIERVNTVLISKLIVDDKNISRLTFSEEAPSLNSNRYDRSVDSVKELQFVGIARARQAQLLPIIENGKIVRVEIADEGRGYLRPPTITIIGKGQDAEISVEIDSKGSIISVNVDNPGQYYDFNTRLAVRRYTVLVNSDETLNGKWALYERDLIGNQWIRVLSQSFNVGLYWEYADWYENGFSQFTNIDHLIPFSFDLEQLNDNIGDIIKIENVGTGGWLLLEKINNQDNVDYTVNYRTIGRQNGTLQFKDTLYDVSKNLVGYDTTSFDVLAFDNVPSIETRIILETIRDNIFVDELAIEYNKIFFASLRYVFSEQKYVDWAFKTSFIKAKHNVGSLDQKITYQNDNLESYEEYIKEVKPYKTKIREYLSNYERIDNSQSMVSDFDLQPRYNQSIDRIEPQKVKVINNSIITQDSNITSYPDKNWADNVGFKVSRIEVADPGFGYISAPIITIVGGGSGAEAVASIGREGRITSINVTNYGNGYLTAPEVIINGSISNNGKPARAVAVIGDSIVRTMHTVIKFDRVSGQFEFINLGTTEEFSASGNKINFDLKWPMDLRTSRVLVFVDNQQILSSRYTYNNYLDTSKGYDRYKGRVSFIDPPAAGSNIRIEYFKNISLLKAQDRINVEYNPTIEQFGKTIGQLMEGVDYGGVEVNSFSFGGVSGWDSDTWFSQGWDVYDTTFEDEIFKLDGSTISIELSKPLEDGVEYNLYRLSYDSNGQLLRNDRLDDPDYQGSPMINKPMVTTNPIIGDGNTVTIFLDELSIPTIPLDSSEAQVVIIVRKSTSDGAFIPDPESYDTALSGGDLAYQSAKGLLAEEITIDGDGFVTPTTSKGPEEVVPGQVLDTLDIRVYERPTGGASSITSRNYVGDGVTRIFDLGISPIKQENLFVKVSYSSLTSSEYLIDYKNNKIIFNNAPELNSKISLISLGESAVSILDIDRFTGDGETVEFLTNARWEDFATAFVTVDGIETDVVLIKSDTSYEYPNNFVIKFATPPNLHANIKIMIVQGTDERIKQYSQVTIDTLISNGENTTYELSQAPFEQEPIESYILVKVNDKVLNSGYNQKFIVQEGLREYQLDLTQVPVASINASDIEAYLNGRKLEYIQEWTFEGAGTFDETQPPDSQPGSTITLERGIAQSGDELRVFVIADGEYRMGYFDENGIFIRTPDLLHLDNPFNEGDIITVYQFSNHNSQGFERINIDVIERTDLTENTEAYFNFRLLQRGLISLRTPAKDAEYVWVVKNGTLLTPSIDYSVTDNKRYVKLDNQPSTGDEIQVIHFADRTVAQSFGWRQFKDLLNRTHYKRLESTYNLAEPLNWYDKTIKVVDATGLPDPEFNAKYPGIIFIESERIEFFSRDGNELKQIRRGTLGTGVKDSYPAGTEFMEQGVSASLPYKDETETIKVTSGGYNLGSTIYPNSAGMSINKIVYNFNNNTAFPVRVPGVFEQTCTVTGTGFTSRVKVLVGETECTTRFINNETIEFDVPGLPVGAYDLIVINPFTDDPIDTPQTSFVLPASIKYVQILLPFAPIPNPKSSRNWYKKTKVISVTDIIPGKGYVIKDPGTTDYKAIGSPNNNSGTEFIATSAGTGTGTVLDFVSIPLEYWEAQDIEVFVGGKRLRKTPINVYEYSDQDSPEGDTTIEAEFAVNKNIGAYVRLTEPPPKGSIVTIIRKIGTVWNPPGIPLGQADTDIAKFLQTRSTDLPR